MSSILTMSQNEEDHKEFNELLVSNLKDRKLRHTEAFRVFAHRFYPEKLNIHVLLDVLKAFQLSSGKTWMQMSTEWSPVYNKYSVDFEFEESIWRGTVDNRATYFRGESVSFINVKVPNDGFIYSMKYVDRNAPILYRNVNLHDQDVADLIEYIGLSINPMFLEKVWFYYDVQYCKFEMYFKCESQKKIFHIGFDYGTPNGHIQKKTMTWNELQAKFSELRA